MNVRTALWVALFLWPLSSFPVQAADPPLDVTPVRYDYMLVVEPTGGTGRVDTLPQVDSSPNFDVVVCNTGSSPGTYWTSIFNPAGQTLAQGACAPLYRIGMLQISTTWRAQIFVRLSQLQK